MCEQVKSCGNCGTGLVDVGRIVCEPLRKAIGGKIYPQASKLLAKMLAAICKHYTEQEPETKGEGWFSWKYPEAGRITFQYWHVINAFDAGYAQREKDTRKDPTLGEVAAFEGGEAQGQREMLANIIHAKKFLDSKDLCDWLDKQHKLQAEGE